ncbi:MAG: NAD(P)/FAD-dependent oxidoreductase [Solirubrobacteraceae bacterium]
MPLPRRVIIVGAGLAGAKAAEALRAEGYDRELVLIGDEPEAPYERPPLSKGYLRGEEGFDAALVQPEAWYAEHAIELVRGVAVKRLDAHERRVELGDGRTLTADAVLLATGAEPRTLPLPGADLDGVLTLRTRRDADALRARLRAGAPVAVIGGGWIGCEVAASARILGCDVTLLEADRAPLARVLGVELGERIAQLHRDHGVAVRCGVAVEGLEGADAVEAVRLSGGERVAAATVVIGVGVAPRTRLARDAGLAATDGIDCDALLRTSAPGVFAAGDVARVQHPRYGRPVRVEHWAAAIDQGVAAAGAILGRTEPHELLPYFFSDQYDTGLEYVGLHEPGDRLVIRPADGSLTALWLGADGRVTAGLQLDDWDATNALRQLLGQPLEPGRAADPGIALAELAV